MVDDDSVDPLAGLANLFDVSVVFIVGLMVALFGTYQLRDIMNERNEVTVVKTNAKGEKEIVVKKGKKVESYKVGSGQGQGQGKRLGTAYQLEGGEMIYVPEETKPDVQP